MGDPQMSTVSETIDLFPHLGPVREILRDERLLLEMPIAKGRKFWNETPEPLKVYQSPAAYEPRPFSPPTGVFESKILRLEWIVFHGRQPFYHRNSDGDEISFQVCGTRTLATEMGCVDLVAGQFSAIPVGVAHDNFGAEDIHLLFYLHGPAVPCIAAARLGDYRAKPIAGWEPKPVIEMTTTGLGKMHGDIAVSLADESLILSAAQGDGEKIQTLTPAGLSGQLTWIYKAPEVWLGHTAMGPTDTRRYQRHMHSDEIQYQFKGTRTVISQRGKVTLGPGEFICIPAGCAFASVTTERSEHLSILTVEPVPPVTEAVRSADSAINA
jgi:uncharacterized cupin superfamily protein